ncbi:Hpt domain-containing protein [Thiohalomonas denitrificans]|uniref:HPt (Histidine-containing phosphotransfer) domain-containing protein n=1 Tax=Thiohalomonas denitrificans TaxID=415747 RepID=A0A1G5QAV9_9GAMM|nr:Hpt domain-containing protein [Thiohalomonas denitrificans]SCZ59005.1 HPt (histidine-containing phosphotransfer) domain-containing protein [Thiohalomonas denitrificans]
MMETALKVIDNELALEQAGGSLELAHELFAMLLKELPQFDSGIQAAFERCDWETLQQSVHKLTGAAIYCGVPALKSASERLDKKLKRGQNDDVGPDVDNLLEEIHRVQEHAHLRIG